MRNALSVLTIWTCLLATAHGEEPVFFADANLKTAVENALWVSDPTPTDMLSLTSLNCTQQWFAEAVITDLTGLEHAVNLQSLYLRLNGISDISPLSGLIHLSSLDISQNEISDLSPLSGLVNLTSLDTHGNQISDISPLSSLENLDYLVLRFNVIRDISPLSGVTRLRSLVLGSNQITDLSPLAGLTQLSDLSAWCNAIGDITPLASLQNLQTLNLGGNKISDISPLSQLPHLSDLDLESNWVDDVSPLCDLTSLRYLDLRNNRLRQEDCDVHIPQIEANNPGITLQYDPCVRHQVVISSAPGGSVTAPGEGEFTFGHGESIRFSAEANPDFTFVGWSGAYSGDANPAYISIDQDMLIQANFESLRETIHVDAGTANDQVTGAIEHPFKSIQEAIDGAAEGACIVVHEGTYDENIDFRGKQLRVTGIDPEHPTDANYPVLRARDDGPVVTFAHGEDPNCTLTGFVLTGGQGSRAGAILCSAASPTITHCLIVGNRATDPNGAAIHCTDSHAAFVNCTIADNWGGERGGGLRVVDSPIVLANSVVYDNTPAEMYIEGGIDPMVSYSDILGGWPGPGNLDVDPLFARPGYWVDSEDLDAALTLAGSVVWVMGDYHLQSQAGRWDPITRSWVQDAATSPCIDMGDPAYPVGSEPAVDGGVINMGAYGGSTQASFGR